MYVFESLFINALIQKDRQCLQNEYNDVDLKIQIQRRNFIVRLKGMYVYYAIMVDPYDFRF